MSPMGLVSRTRHSGFPRVSGDEPQVGGVHADEDVFSPRERG